MEPVTRELGVGPPALCGADPRTTAVLAEPAKALGSAALVSGAFLWNP